jgi:hypothetical protein
MRSRSGALVESTYSETAMRIAISVARTALERPPSAFCCGAELTWLPSHEAARPGRLDDPLLGFGAGSFVGA